LASEKEIKLFSSKWLIMMNVLLIAEYVGGGDRTCGYIKYESILFNSSPAMYRGRN
jgi:hypothetical protein